MPGRAKTRYLIAGGVLLGLVVSLVLAVLITTWLRRLPSVDDLGGRVQATLAAHDAPYTPLAEVPPALQQALILTEDEHFYQDAGIDPIGLGRAALDDLRAGRMIEGGSTLTEQLAKNVYVGQDSTIGHKLESMTLALEIGHRYSRRQLLEWYLNRVYLGDGAYGVGAAAQAYFHEPVDRLNLAECALLAGLPQAPEADNPLTHPRAAARRQAEVLARLVDAGVITSAQASAAQRTLAADVVATAT
jgi:membrane peptidoglycan carboxypeptidase